MDTVARTLRSRHFFRQQCYSALKCLMNTHVPPFITETDISLVENAICPTALGKKNWLFIGDADVGEERSFNWCRRRLTC